MPYPDWSKTQDGDTFDGPALKAQLQTIADAINDVEEGATKRHTLGRFHLQPPVFHVQSAALGTGTHTYNDTANPYPGWNTVAGWAPVTDGVTPLAATFSPVLDLTSAHVAGVLVLADIMIVDLTYTIFAASMKYYAYFALQITDNLGTTYHLPLSECYTDIETRSDDDEASAALAYAQKACEMQLEYFITSTDLPAGRTLASVKLVTSMRDASGGAGEIQMTLEQGAFLAMPLHAQAI